MAQIPKKNNEPASSERESDARMTTRSSPGTVVIGCKLPNGLILQLSTFEQSSEPVMGGGHREVRVGRKIGTKYVIRGTSIPFGQIPKFIFAGGYALTSGVPEEFWDQWYEQNKDSDIVRRELIVAHKSMDDVETHCNSNESLLTGLEPINPDKLPRGVQTATKD